MPYSESSTSSPLETNSTDYSKGGSRKIRQGTRWARWGPGNVFSHKRISQRAVQGAQWLSGRVLDSRPKGSGFEPHRRHCVMVLEQDTCILA